MKANTRIMSMTRIILIISSFLLLTSCVQKQPRELYKTADGGYCYQDSDLLWHMFIYNQVAGCYVESTSTVAPTYDASTSYSPEDVGIDTSDISTEMTETTGEDTGGSESSDTGSDADTSDSGMSESGGSDMGGSDSFDSGGFDGGGDSGGGDGGGGE